MKKLSLLFTFVLVCVLSHCHSEEVALPTEELLDTEIIVTKIVDSLRGPDSTDTCTKCLVAEKMLKLSGVVGLILADKAKPEICSVLIKKVTMISQAECVHLLNQMQDIPKILLTELMIKNSGFLCHILLGICPASQSTLEYFNSTSYVHTIMSTPKVKGTAVPRTQQTLKLLHFSDAHIKLAYKVGSDTSAGAGFAACEQFSQDPKAHQAGMFGDAHCDSPQALFESFLTAASAQSPDIILYTGDNNDHDLLHYENKNNFTETNYIARRLKETFPNAVIIPTLGNIETAPQDHQFDTLTKSMSWALKSAADAYSAFLTPQQVESLGSKGYYSVEMPQYGLRVISLFSALWDPMNFFLLDRTPNPNGIFDFISAQLQQAELNDEKVIFLSHSPAGPSMNSNMGRIVSAFMERYSDTILAHFAGHYHRDIMTFYSSSLNKANITVPCIAVASLSPIGSGVPSFRIWEYETASQHLMDYTQYKFDLAAANKDLSPAHWSESYKFRSVYSLPDASKSSMQALYTSLVMNSHNLTSVYVSLRDSYSTVPHTLTPQALHAENCRLLGDIKSYLMCQQTVNPKGHPGLFELLGVLYKDFFTRKDTSHLE